MDGQPFDIASTHGKVRVRRWSDGGRGPWDRITVELGQLSDGTWYTYGAGGVWELTEAGRVWLAEHDTTTKE